MYGAENEPSIARQDNTFEKWQEQLIFARNIQWINPDPPLAADMLQMPRS